MKSALQVFKETNCKDCNCSCDSKDKKEAFDGFYNECESKC